MNPEKSRFLEKLSHLIIITTGKLNQPTNTIKAELLRSKGGRKEGGNDEKRDKAWEPGAHEIWRCRKSRPRMESEQRRTRSTSAARDTALARRTAQW